MADMLITLVNFIIKGLGAILSLILSVLPSSPFNFIMSFDFSQYTGFCDWLLPIPEILATIEVWLSAIVVYYVYQIVLRWIKAIG